jgi:hypothetical protein
VTRLPVTSSEAAESTGLAEATIRSWAARGLLRRYGTSQRRLYDLAQVGAVRESQRSRMPNSPRKGSPGRPSLPKDVLNALHVQIGATHDVLLVQPVAPELPTVGDGTMLGEARELL